MGDHNLPAETSESIEMYLLRIALLQQHSRPVPVPLLAQELAVSPVSANEMCRKLTERELIDYEPYKGVTLKAPGEILARRVLRCRRLWEVFFVDWLGIAPAPAETMACRFEHVTPAELADSLAAFLDYPRLSPQNEPIPYDEDQDRAAPPQRLAGLKAGQQGQVVSLTGLDDLTRDFLRQQGFLPGRMVEVLGVGADETRLVQVSGQTLMLAADLAAQIEIKRA